MASGKFGNSLHDLFTVDKNGKTRGHSLKLIKKLSKGNTRHQSSSLKESSRDGILYHTKQCVLHLSTLSKVIWQGYVTRRWASSRIADPLSLDSTGLANPASNPVSKIKIFSFWRTSSLGPNWSFALGPWRDLRPQTSWLHHVLGISDPQSWQLWSLSCIGIFMWFCNLDL